MITTFLVAFLVVEFTGGATAQLLIGLCAALGGVVVLLMGVFTWSLTWAPVNLDRAHCERHKTLQSERLYYRKIIEGQEDHKHWQSVHAAFIDEGSALMDMILYGDDAQMPNYREQVKSWRDCTRAFLVEHAYGGAADGSDFFHAFNKSHMEFTYKGGRHSGERAVLASQVDFAISSLQAQQMIDRSYLEFDALDAEAKQQLEAGDGD